MGKNIKFFKKVTSLVLAGLTIFSSVPAKAFEEEDPREAIQAEVYSKLQQGYKKITESDIENYDPITGDSGIIVSGFKEYGGLITHPIDSFKCFFDSKGSKINFDFKYFKKLCKRKGWSNEDIVELFFPTHSRDSYAFLQQINFPNLVKVELNTNRDEASICLLADSCIGTTFSKCPDLKLLRVTGNRKIGFLNDDYFNTERKEHIDLFPSCKHSVLVVCDTREQVESFKKIMGKKGDRHKVLLADDLKKFDNVKRKALNLNCCNKIKVPEKLTYGFVEYIRRERNIVIPKHVKGIEEYAFKDTGVVGVTFEEGMTEIEFCDGCFAGCPLVKFELPKSLKKIVLGKNCFAGCPNELYIENYVRGEIERIEKEKEAEKQRVRDEVKKAASYIIDRQAKEKAAYLEKIKEENEQRIKNRKEKIEEAIKALEANKLKAVGAQEERQKDLDEKIKVDTSSMNEVEIKIFNAEKAMLEAKLEAANSNLELINTDLQGKNEMLQELDNSLNVLKIKAEFEKIFSDLQEREVKLSKTLGEIKERIKKAEAEEKRNKEEAERLAKIAKKQAETAREQAREQQRLDEEKKKLEEEKNKGFFTGLGEKISSFSPVESVKEMVNDSIVKPLKDIGHKAVVGCKIALGVGAAAVALIGAGLVAKTVTPIVNLCTSIKKFFQTKSKKVVPQKPSNSTSATPV